MRSLLTSLAVCAALMPAVGQAQDLSEEELLQMFLAQRDAYKAAVEGNTALTRGLTLITADDVEIATEVATQDTATETAGTEVASDASAGAVKQPTETVVSSNETATLVKMPEGMGVNIRIEFAFDSAALDDAQKPKLQTLCNVMRTADIQLFRIIGHTDASGSDDYNERLSRLRAEEVQRFFVNDCGIAANRLEAVGLGERFLLEDYDPDSDQNRRVEFQALS
ncbi:OmpA family protein [Tabrizicola sp.]|uniref:OmpA family protein n=1 Tax=Tabrizicola sp. TaxID=2005166 RepID=UPI002733FCA7|nr:OmpA family protein [Tabrizicola sp.]MDP3195634.1 OmpA family protein [Tabrizicola sp.]